MSKGKKIKTTEQLLEECNDLLKKQLIVQLAGLGVSQRNIREITGGDLNFIGKVLKPVGGKVVK